MRYGLKGKEKTRILGWCPISAVSRFVALKGAPYPSAHCAFMSRREVIPSPTSQCCCENPRDDVMKLLRARHVTM